MSDHYFNFIFRKNVTKTEPPKTVTYRPFIESNVSKIKEALETTNFSIVFEINDPSVVYDNLINIYNDTLNNTTPLKTVRFNKYKHSINHWVTK